MSEKIVLGLDFGSDPIRAFAVSYAAVPVGAYDDIATAQKLMASRIEHAYQPNPNVVPHFDRLYQRYSYKDWATQSEPLYAPAETEN